MPKRSGLRIGVPFSDSDNFFDVHGDRNSRHRKALKTLRKDVEDFATHMRHLARAMGA
ncbi:hypothetical protein CVS47_01467 [Microbacterium lemovicicum]|uniref:Uncharacterized protein n=2 Tax=Microbacterium lemovicicum TaxID=1072463 RepID=A0A3Q9IXN6_9MICO|nr:hypothetical protein CVS47_00204 [Microbacterium lemovicicum]AZS36853.1 hypothetical protein CVS47_01467 [Microbacterium lemovicicum]